jgi:F0F1-type ATP synthase membrane subunit b/b'
LVILNFLLFRPVLRILDERERVVRESAELKENLGKLTGQSMEEYERKLLSAKQEAQADSTRETLMKDARALAADIATRLVGRKL